mmetsp:Transcript_6904/g.19464  ORF Transcript_6904/g.19464 Transcript_6904/m.19464 type:complete len:280 (+) Transcript_6904:155-994(+)|eukprot:CAMPEP_0117655202 /NCGR_PEP_ID=MMETSP0804-20121206/4156_1 /TAXON_ID=1074897 /ORGANISM="Tetraselmis astigmatica, Strain CCMP880" /LENGTH=279 /DNA_ID=CAMNT_0005461543 /DNA_START=309 /DNA_END=1148 /DNA_ORIENTATION=+
MVNENQLKALKAELLPWVKEAKCGPLLVRIAWHDCGAHDASKAAEWPKCGGANGSIRFAPEINHGANKGLINAVKLLEPFKVKYPEVSYADLYQMASVCAIEAAGGPAIVLKYGRMDADSPEGCVEEGNLPAGAAPWPKDAGCPEKHLRDVFYRMGLSDQDIVALSGAHTLGRAHKDRSGLCHKESTKYTADGPGTKGGASWTPDWLTFSNDYFKVVKEASDPELLVLATDACLFTDPKYKVFAEKYAEDKDAFFADYVASHKKLSECGAKFEEGAVEL